MPRKSFKLNNSELKELEKLILKFGEKFSLVDIVGEFVYGIKDNQRKFLGTRTEYENYRKLKSRNYSKDNKFDKYKVRESYIKDLSKD